MKKWKCMTCGYIYDEAKGMPEFGIEPGTPFESCRMIGSALTVVQQRMSLLLLELDAAEIRCQGALPSIDTVVLCLFVVRNNNIKG